MKKAKQYFFALIIGLAISTAGLIAGYYAYRPIPIMPKETIEIPPPEESVTKNTVIRYIHSFTQDGITQENEALAPYYMIGMTKQQLTEEMSGWNIESFSPAMVVLSKNIDGKSPQHYILKIKDGYVAVYYENGTLKEITNTPASTLSVTEQLELENGIEIDGNFQLAKILENLES